jgi:aldose 1-epimerase
MLGTSEEFRELVAFTPAHRQAVCLEPYTCITDAINLQQRGIPAGLLVLAPGGRWTGVVGLVGMP